MLLAIGVAAGDSLIATRSTALPSPSPSPSATPEPAPACPQTDQGPGMSVARRWDEALLDAIRRSLPNPPVHARNLFHLSVAMWDAWAAYDPTAPGYLFKEKHYACDVTGARTEAISYAAYRILTARFAKAVGGDQSLSKFAEIMDAYSYPTALTTTEGDLPSAVGNRIAKAVLDYGMTDGSNEANAYVATDYQAVNPPLVVANPDITLADPNRWQPLQIENLVSQNGVALPSGVQTAVGAHWGHVLPFAVPSGGPAGIPFDPGPPPRLGNPATDAAYKSQAVEVIRDSSLLDSTSDATMDISPAAIGGNELGTNNGHGRTLNPVTNQPYSAEVVRRGDFYRSIAEFWADGPNSETPPGHWNVLANSVSDQLAPNLRLGGTGPVLDRLQWDVKLYLALNGSVHDAAIAAWGLKGHYDGIRPISMIRYLAACIQQGRVAARAGSHRGHHARQDGAGWVDGRTPRPRGEDRDPFMAAESHRPTQPAVVACRLDPRNDVDPVSARDVRHPVVPGVHLGTQHVQPRGRRGPRGNHR